MQNLIIWLNIFIFLMVATSLIFNAGKYAAFRYTGATAMLSIMIYVFICDLRELPIESSLTLSIALLGGLGWINLLSHGRHHQPRDASGKFISKDRKRSPLNSLARESGCSNDNFL